MLIDNSKEKLYSLMGYLYQNINDPNIEKIFYLLIIINYEYFSQTARTITNSDYLSLKLIDVPVYYDIINTDIVCLDLFSVREITCIEKIVNKYKYLHIQLIRNQSMIQYVELYSKLHDDILQLSNENREFIDNYK